MSNEQVAMSNGRKEGCILTLLFALCYLNWLYYLLASVCGKKREFRGFGGEKTAGSDKRGLPFI